MPKFIISQAHFDYSMRLHKTLESWHNTPYVPYGQAEGAGVDCVRFVAAVGDALLGVDRHRVPRIHSDVALHQPTTARSSMRYLMARYDMRKVDPGVDGVYVLEPADVLVYGPKGGGPGHATIQGPHGFLWHAANGVGVRKTSPHNMGMDFFHVLRRRGGWSI